MVLRDSLGGEGLLKFVEFGETNYLLLRLDEKSPGCPSWWPRWPCHGGSDTELPWWLLWLQECPRSCWWPSLCCPVPTAEPLWTLTQWREKKLCCGITTSRVLALLWWGQNDPWWNGPKQRRWLFPGVWLAWGTPQGNQEEAGSVCGMPVPSAAMLKLGTMSGNQSYQITKLNTCSVYFF